MLNNIDLAVGGPGIVAILGPNGSGKSTLIKSLLGLVIPDQGEIFLADEKINRQWKYREKISYLPQLARFPENLKVKELSNLIKDLRQQHACREEELIRLFNLESFLNKPLRNLSGGTRQKVNILLSLMFDNPVLVLDEPTVGLDPVAIIQLKKWLNQERKDGKLILLTSHIMKVVEELANEIIFLLEGDVYFQGTQSDLEEITGESNLEASIAGILMRNNAVSDAKSNQTPMLIL